MPLAIIRHLPPYQPILHAVVMESSDPEVDDQESYMRCKAQEIMDEFKRQFVEFSTAEFYLQPIIQSQLFR